MKSAWTYLEQLSRHPHRGTATRGEAAAAGEMKSWLEQLGYRVTAQPFRTPVDTLYLGPAIVMLAFVLAAVAGRTAPWVGLVLCVAFLIPMVGEMLGSFRIDFDMLLPTYPSRNLIAVRPAAAPARRTVVISAHYDTQRASLLFHPTVAPHLQTYFSTVYGLIMAVPVLLIFRWALGASAWVNALLLTGVGLLAVNILFLLACKLTGRHINGANDNGSGTALLLALADRFAAEPVSDTQLIFLLTGAEEVGTRGMKHFIRHTDLDPETTLFVNLDNIGGGALHYLLGEGMLAFRPYGQELVQLAEQMAAEHDGAVRPKRNLLLPTDGLMPSLAGYSAISFLAFMEDGSLPNYHWYSDTLENVDPDLLGFAERFLVDYIRRAAAGSGVTDPA